MAPDSKLCVLFIEDSEVDAELILVELEREGFDVTWDRVEDELGLRQQLASKMPDVILSDYSMPTFSGIEALKVVREIDPDIPFLFVSGTIGEDRAIESIRQGATDYILKENLRRLGTAIRRALSETEERKLAQAAEAARLRLAAILEATSDFVAISDPDLHVTYLNAAGRRLLGIGEDEDITGLQISKFHPDWPFKLVNQEFGAALERDGIWEGETALLTRTGEEIPISQVIIAHRDSEGELSYLSTIGRDIRDRKAYEQQISYLANYDGLTDLPNRALLRDRTLQGITHARRSGRSIALLILDVDRFKLVNDGFGQETGDVLLRMIGEKLLGVVRDGDTVARLGADGFAVLAADLHRHDDILGVTRKLQESIREPFVLKGQETLITLSIGVSVFPRDGEDFESLLRNAEAAMHRAKTQGRGGIEYYTTQMTRDAEDRVEVENALRQALQHDGLEMHYQTQISIESGRIVGSEALMRWQRNGHGWVSPGLFIPVAEESDLILSLDEFALTTACRQLYAWNNGNTEMPLRMSVNVSARQFRSPGFVDTVARVLDETVVTPQCLELELTEGILIENRDQVMNTLGQLKELGVRISVDDFGTGYSSLSYLSRLPVDCLKIDQSFVHSLSDDTYNAHIVQAVISLAHSLEMNVIAEGIETEEQLEFLRNQGCDEGQGFLISRPVPASDLAGILNNWPSRVENPSGVGEE